MTKVFLLTPEELTQILGGLDDIKRMLADQAARAAHEKPISHKQAAAFLNIHPDTLTDRLREGMYPASIVHMNGRRRQYFMSELHAFIAKKRGGK